VRRGVVLARVARPSSIQPSPTRLPTTELSGSSPEPPRGTRPRLAAQERVTRALSCAWPTTSADFGSVEVRLWAFQNFIQLWPPSILSGQAEFIILRGGRSGDPRQRLAVIPGHPRSAPASRGNSWASAPPDFPSAPPHANCASIPRMEPFHQRPAVLLMEEQPVFR
jgi:hypothetical protein